MIHSKKWLESRIDFMKMVGWAESYTDPVNEYRAMLIALKKDCTNDGIGYMLCTTGKTIITDRSILGLTAKKGGANRKTRMFSHRGKLLSCEQVAKKEGCCYNTAYGRLTKGIWKV